MAKLPRMAALERLVQILQERQPRRGDADADDTAIVGGAIALDQATLLQLVEQARDVRRPRYQPTGQVQRLDPLGMLAAQNPERVVLLMREVVLAEELVFQGAQAVVSAPEIEEHFLFERVETGRQRLHAVQYNPLANTCPDNYRRNDIRSMIRARAPSDDVA